MHSVLPEELQPNREPFNPEVRPDHVTDVMGYGIGEATIGLFVQTSVRHFSGDTYWLIVGGIQGRIPLLAEIFFFYL